MATDESMTLLDPSHIKNNVDKVLKLKEDVDKHKREIELLEQKLATHQIAQAKFEEETEKKFAALIRKIDGHDDAQHLQIQSAIHTATSFNKKATVNQILTNSDIPGLSRGSKRSQVVRLSQHSRKSAAIIVKTEASREKSVGSQKAEPTSPLP